MPAAATWRWPRERRLSVGASDLPQAVVDDSFALQTTVVRSEQPTLPADVERYVVRNQDPQFT